MFNNAKNSKTHKLKKYEDDKYMDRIHGGKKLHNPAQQNEYDDNNFDIDDLEKENPNLAAQCRQLFPKI